MKIELGARVHTSDGQDIGTIDQLVLDPATNEIKSAVIHKGAFLGRDVEVPLTSLEPDRAGGARLAYTAEQVDDLPEFFASNYTTSPPPGYVPIEGYPLTGLLYWSVPHGMTPPLPMQEDSLSSAESEDVTEALRRQDIENALISEGGDVKSRDGQKIGTLHHLTFDPDTNQLARFVVRNGFLFTEDIDLPASLIAVIEDGVVYLTSDADWFDMLSDLTPGREVWTSDGVRLGVITRREDDDLLVSSVDETSWVRVPITAVDRLEDARVALNIDSTEVARLVAWPAIDPAVDRFDVAH
jgi:sporulation protein YlmC with PRC-barrel domain